eukprot:Hpha_TRINITY_DN16385_c2_g2::TRINITY_DN16385_c2_g2_i1::g.58204::m.58204
MLGELGLGEAGQERERENTSVVPSSGILTTLFTTFNDWWDTLHFFSPCRVFRSIPPPLDAGSVVGSVSSEGLVVGPVKVLGLNTTTTLVRTALPFGFPPP